MAIRRAASVLARRSKAVAEQSKSGVSRLNARQRFFFTSAWSVPLQGEYAESGLLAVSTRAYRHPFPEWTFPWALQGFQKPRQMLLPCSAEERRESRFRDDDEGDDQEERRKSRCRDDDEGKDQTEENPAEESEVSVRETRKIVQQVNAVALKNRLKCDPRDSFSYRELLDFIKEAGVASNNKEASRFARILDEAGVVLIFRDNVYIHPERVAKLVAHALPFAVVPMDDPRRAELLQLEQQKAEIDDTARRQVRRYLWTGLLALTLQAALFFRLTFWELSWDVMEPIAFFVGSAGLIVGYTFFLFTAKDPTYKDFMDGLFRSRRLKLFKKNKFDHVRYQSLRRQCQCLDLDDKN